MTISWKSHGAIKYSRGQIWRSTVARENLKSTLHPHPQNRLVFRRPASSNRIIASSKGIKAAAAFLRHQSSEMSADNTGNTECRASAGHEKRAPEYSPSPRPSLVPFFSANAPPRPRAIFRQESSEVNLARGHSVVLARARVSVIANLIAR